MVNKSKQFSLSIHTLLNNIGGSGLLGIKAKLQADVKKHHLMQLHVKLKPLNVFFAANVSLGICLNINLLYYIV